MKENVASSKGKPGPRPRKHVPLRTCVACHHTRDKRQLVRVVRTLSGRVEVDPTGKKAGRGAYLCAQKSCWQLASKKHALDHALQTAIGPDDLKALDEYAATLE